MLIGGRIKERLKAMTMTQSELARRVGLTQPAIANLIHRNKSGSSHLHLIARELQTTPEYLTGETDDPELDAPIGTGVVVLDSEDREILRLLDKMSTADKRALIQVARSMAKIPAKSDTLHDSRRGYRQRGE